jgi:PAS domain S-box-containing protein
MATGESRYGEGAFLSVPGICKDGRQIALEFTIVPLRNEQGTMTGMVAVIRDVTIRFTEPKVLRERLAKVTEDRAGPP